MSYTPTNWQTGDIVSSEKLNKMEEGIANAHSVEYIVAETDEWLEENITQETGYVLDRSLQSANAAAPADIVGDIQEDVSDAKNAIDAKAPLIINTASGDIASFADGANGGKIRKIVGTIVTPEGGSGCAGANITRTKANICGGLELANKIKDTGRSEATLDTENKTISCWGAAWVGKDIIKLPFKKNTSYTIVLVGRVSSDESRNTQIIVNYTDGTTGSLYFDQAGVEKGVCRYVSANTKTIASLRGTYLGNTTKLYYEECGIFEGDIPIGSFTPYVANTLPINWQSSAGTILNGTVTLNDDGSVDVVNSDTSDSYHLTNVGSLSTYFGTNNVWIDTGSITECDYPADTKLYIDGLTAPDEDMIANANIASGKYFVVNNQLYLSTAAIAAGASIVPGTNCTATNLAEALNALNT